MIIETKNLKRFIIDEEDECLLDGVTASVTSHGYVRLVRYHGIHDGKPKYTQRYLHRIVVGADEGQYVDHINGDKLDNRKENLRVCSNAQNSRNKKQYSGAYKGVHFNKVSGNWIAQITVNYKCKHIGSFNTAEEAALAYNKAAKQFHGEFAFQNEVQ